MAYIIFTIVAIALAVTEEVLTYSINKDKEKEKKEDV